MDKTCLCFGLSKTYFSAKSYFCSERAGRRTPSEQGLVFLESWTWLWMIEDTPYTSSAVLMPGASHRLARAKETGQHMVTTARTFVLSSTSRGVAEYIAIFRRLFELVRFK